MKRHHYEDHIAAEIEFEAEGCRVSANIVILAEYDSYPGDAPEWYINGVEIEGVYAEDLESDADAPYAPWEERVIEAVVRDWCDNHDHIERHVESYYENVAWEAKYGPY